MKKYLASGLLLLLLLTSCDEEQWSPLQRETSSPPADVGPDTGADALVPDVLIPDLAKPDMTWPTSCPQSLKGLSGQALKTAIHDLVKGHSPLGYTKARQAIFLAKAGGIDLVGGEVEGIYTGRKSKISGDTIPSDLNVEHSWPQSLGSSTEPARSDLHHLFPCDAKANTRRSNHPYGETDCINCNCVWSEGGSTLGYSTGCTQRVFKVRTARSGDIARAQFYFALRYQHDNNDAIAGYVEQVLRAWDAQDPVDSKERTRNAAIETYQNNRNPFVDCPVLSMMVQDF